MQYGMEKATPGQFELTGSLHSPPPSFRIAVIGTRADVILRESMLFEYVSKLVFYARFQRERPEPGTLYGPTYDHEDLGYAIAESKSHESHVRATR